ncbi:hypothetical protein JCM8547_001047 [Rhodosporidiobolus lusitaniae]
MSPSTSTDVKPRRTINDLPVELKRYIVQLAATQDEAHKQWYKLAVRASQMTPFFRYKVTPHRSTRFKRIQLDNNDSAALHDLLHRAQDFPRLHTLSINREAISEVLVDYDLEDGWAGQWDKEELSELNLGYEALSHLAPRLTTLELTSNFASDLAGLLSMVGDTVKTLVVGGLMSDWGSDVDLIEVLARAPALRKLSIHACHPSLSLDDFDIFEEHWDSLSPLEVLEFRAGYISSSMAKLIEAFSSTLCELSIDCGADSVADTSVAASGTFPLLHSLSFIGSTCQYVPFWSALAPEQLPALRTLHLRPGGVSQLYQHELRPLVRATPHLPTLHFLTISFSELVTERDVCRHFTQPDLIIHLSAVHNDQSPSPLFFLYDHTVREVALEPSKDNAVVAAAYEDVQRATEYLVEAAERARRTKDDIAMVRLAGLTRALELERLAGKL